MEIIGHQKQWNFLKKKAEKDCLSHAYLFSGQDKLGKRTLAFEWLSVILGKDFQRKEHPDLNIIEPEKKEIQISQIRDLIWKLSLKPYSIPFKIGIIDQAHLMNQEAQTSILKTLEEPRGRTILILISQAPEYLFPTILSRVQTVKFYPVRKEEILSYLKKQGVPGKESERISSISLGRPGIAIDFLSDLKKLDLYQGKIKEIDKVLNSEVFSRFQYANYLAQEPQNLKENLDILLNYFRIAMLGRINNQESLPKYPLSKIKNIIKLIQKTNLLISTTNVNSRLALENLMLEF